MDKEKLKVLFVGDLVVETGFSTVNHSIIKYLEDDFDITGLGVNYNGDPHGFSFPVYPALTAGGGNIYGLDRLTSLLLTNDYDVLFILNDAWVISYYLDVIKKTVNKKLPKIVVYFPVDSRYHDREWYKDYDIVSKAYTYTDFGKKVVNNPYCLPELKLEVMPHGVDTTDFFKMYESRSTAKAELLTGGNPDEGRVEDLFIVLNANRNQPRKRLDTTIAGFAMFADGKPANVKLYMHCGIIDSHIDVIKECRKYGVSKRLIITNKATSIQRISKQKLNLIYNACDVGVNTSLGEGWGLTNMEHAVTGAAQIVPRHSSCQELFSDCGLLCETVIDWTFDAGGTVGRVTTPEELARNLDILYYNPELRQELSDKAREKFLRPEYQWKNIAQKWGEIFKEVCS